MDNHLKMRRVLKTAQLFVVDAFSIFASFGLAVLLFRFVETAVDIQQFLSLIPVIIVVKIAFYYISTEGHNTLNSQSYINVYLVNIC